MAEVAVVVLAAGASRRLGRPKQRLPYKGQTLLRYVVGQALAAGVGPVVVVLGAGAPKIAPDLAGLPVQVVVNRRWREGMASSIRTGVRAVMRSFPQAAALILMLADQPLISSSLLRRLAEAFRQGRPVAACRYQGETVGPPAMFARPLWPKLLALRGDVGAQSIIVVHQPLLLPFPQGAVDIDTEADWQAFLHGGPSGPAPSS